MKWVVLLLLIVAVFVVLWKYGYVEQFLGPWAAWSNWIGYYSGNPGVRPSH
jgi:hypothetical protein